MDALEQAKQLALSPYNKPAEVATCLALIEIAEKLGQIASALGVLEDELPDHIQNLASVIARKS